MAVGPSKSNRPSWVKFVTCHKATRHIDMTEHALVVEVAYIVHAAE
jgi:hypothetical protein